MLCGSKLRAALSSHLRRHSSAFSLPLRRFSSTVTAAATATMASNHHPKDESYLNQVIPKRIQLFQSIQAKLLTERLSLSSDPIKYISPKNPNPRIFHTHSILIWIFFFFFEGLRCRMGLWRKGRSGWHRHWTLRERFRRVWLPTLWFLRSMGFSGTCLGLWSLIVSSSSSLLNPTKAATLSGTPALTFSARYDLCIVDFSHLGFFLKRKFECLA